MDIERKRKNVSAKAINEYWKGEIEGESGGLWESKIGCLSYEVILEDSGECCYACGRRGSTQKCHILPYSLGGDEAPCNMFLLCYRCHSKNPDTKYPELFYAYVKSTLFYVTQDMLDFNIACDKYVSTLTLRDQRLCEHARSNKVAVSSIVPLLLEELSGCSGAMGGNTDATKAYLYIKLLLAYTEAQNTIAAASSIGEFIY